MGQDRADAACLPDQFHFTLQIQLISAHNYPFVLGWFKSLFRSSILISRHLFDEFCIIANAVLTSRVS